MLRAVSKAEYDILCGTTMVSFWVPTIGQARHGGLTLSCDKTGHSTTRPFPIASPNTEKLDNRRPCSPVSRVSRFAQRTVRQQPRSTREFPALPILRRLLPNEPNRLHHYSKQRFGIALNLNGYPARFTYTRLSLTGSIPPNRTDHDSIPPARRIGKPWSACSTVSYTASSAGGPQPLPLSPALSRSLPLTAAKDSSSKVPNSHEPAHLYSDCPCYKPGRAIYSLQFRTLHLAARQPMCIHVAG